MKGQSNLGHALRRPMQGISRL